MKYKQFIFLRNSIILVLVLGGVFAIGMWTGSGPKEEQVETNPQNNNYNSNPSNNSGPSTNTASTNSNTGSNQSADYKLSLEPTITKVHEEIMAFQKNTPLSEGKPDENNGGVKLFKKFPTYQMDLRCDKAKGFNYWNRLKLDWDYDKKWDEKWDFRENGSIKRQCSTNDDEVYDVVVETVDGKWQKK